MNIDNSNNLENHTNGRGTSSSRPTINQEQLQKLVAFITTNLVTQKDKVEVSVMEDIPGAYTVYIKVAPEDKGRIIGKNGNTINALRTLMKVFGRIIVIVQD
ncbi:MAG: hypothetical protein KatS3mg084_0347 [Candidatus Dojkabacteria bacterium]|nr:MAG: hypothetical protein KatS3mg084_0347 [Candidatus Dojkabacteria bacterium]